MLYLALTAKLCSTIFFFGAWCNYIPPKHIQKNDRECNENTQNEPEQEVTIYNNNWTYDTDDHFFSIHYLRCMHYFKEISELSEILIKKSYYM